MKKTMQSIVNEFLAKNNFLSIDIYHSEDSSDWTTYYSITGSLEDHEYFHVTFMASKPYDDARIDVAHTTDNPLPLAKYLKGIVGNDYKVDYVEKTVVSNPKSL